MLGERLRTLRLRTNQTQQQIADQLGITAQRILISKMIVTNPMARPSSNSRRFFKYPPIFY